MSDTKNSESSEIQERPKFLQLPANEKGGRDFIVSDLHGQYDKLMERMNYVQFDVTKDRLFSVGDLCDRGPDSVKCMRLIYEPWFYAVQGNHDRMFFTFTETALSTYHTRDDFINNGGGWVHGLDKAHLKTLAEDMMKLMPLAIETPDFKIAHARLEPNFSPDQIDPDEFVWDRTLRNVVFKNAHEDFGKAFTTSNNQLFMLNRYDPEKKIVYVGHNTWARGHNIFIQDHFMTDSGAGYGERLTFVNHAEVIEKLLSANSQFDVET